MKTKKLFNLLMVLVMLMTSFAAIQPAEAQGDRKLSQRSLADGEYVADEVVVVFADSQEKSLVAKIEQAVETANDTGGEVTRLSLDGSAVIQVDGDAAAAAAELSQQPNVLYAEPNYVFSVPEVEASAEEGYKANSEYVFRRVVPSASSDWKSIMAVPKTTIQGMSALGIYPSDTYLTENQGWDWVEADIVWPNTTASANVCVIDTGIDAVHPDLKVGTLSKVLKGYDFVDADAVAEDQNGHGTHVAGIIAAFQNNKLGMAGVSTGKVVAVRAMDAQGVGTNFDIAAAIAYCANRTDIRVINLSLGGPTPSQAIEDALLYATTPTNDTVPSGTYQNKAGKGKLVVAAAGNNGNNTPIYPAAYAADTDFPNNRILSVAASGGETGVTIDYDCRAAFSNYGTWVTVIAPGNDIFSLTPWDKPFYRNYINGVNTRFDYMDGTSMAAAFVSAAAARRMGYKPSANSQTVGTDVRNLGSDVSASCAGPYAWADNVGTKQVNVAKLLDRAAIEATAFDATAGTPLDKATLSAYGGATKYGSSILTADTFVAGPDGDIDPNRVFTYYQGFVDILNLPVKNSGGADILYTVKVNKAGYTVGDQPAFQHLAPAALEAGTTSLYYNGSVPRKAVHFNVVLGWDVWEQFAAVVPEDQPVDLDLYLWLPTPGVPAYGQPAQFIVGYDGDAFGFLEADSYGTMNAFPYARLKREGGYTDGGPTVETITIANRKAHNGLAANAALPFWVGTYNVLATDYGQTIDHDNDGCGDNYGFDYSSSPAPCGGTQGIPLLGAYYTPYLYVWKDGVVKYFQNGADDFGPWAAEVEPAENTNNCNDHWWKAFSIFSGTGGTAPTYTRYGTASVPLCDDGATGGFLPYVGYVNQPNDRIVVLNK